MALLEFLQAHAHDWVLDAAAMARLNDELVPAALQAWPELQGVLQTRVEGFRMVPWTADHGFTEAPTREQVFALTQQLMLQVGPPVSPSFLFSSFLPFSRPSSSSSSSSSFFLTFFFLLSSSALAFVSICVFY